MLHAILKDMPSETERIEFGMIQPARASNSSRNCWEKEFLGKTSLGRRDWQGNADRDDHGGMAGLFEGV